MEPGRVLGGSRASARIDLELDEGDGAETASPAGRALHLDAQAGVRAGARAPCGSTAARSTGSTGRTAFVDDSAGYHPRRTAWRWSAGVGTSEDGRPVGWNLVEGVQRLGPRAASAGCGWTASRASSSRRRSLPTCPRWAACASREWSAREDHTNLLLLRSDYRQPFGTFEGEVGGVRLREGYGVMEQHDVRW